MSPNKYNFQKLQEKNKIWKTESVDLNKLVTYQPTAYGLYLDSDLKIYRLYMYIISILVYVHAHTYTLLTQLINFNTACIVYDFLNYKIIIFDMLKELKGSLYLLGIY